MVETRTGKKRGPCYAHNEGEPAGHCVCLLRRLWNSLLTKSLAAADDLGYIIVEH
jgi:hypothetical protein